MYHSFYLYSKTSRVQFWIVLGSLVCLGTGGYFIIRVASRAVILDKLKSEGALVYFDMQDVPYGYVDDPVFETKGRQSEANVWFQPFRRIRFINTLGNEGALVAAGKIHEVSYIWISGEGSIDLSPLSGLSDLQVLHINGLHIKDLAVVLSLPKLRTLEILNNDTSDLTRLQGCYHLQKVIIPEYSHADYSRLRTLLPQIGLRDMW